MAFLVQFFEKTESSLGGLEPPTFRLTAERANRLRHRDSTCEGRVKDEMPRDHILHTERLPYDAKLNQIMSKGSGLNSNANFWKKLCASAGSRTRVDCLEGNHANRYTTDA